MKELDGDLWLQRCDARVITTNGTISNISRGVTAKGVPVAARDRYPGIEARLARLLRRYGTHTLVVLEPADNFPIVALPVKHRWEDRTASRPLILRSVQELVALTDARGWQKVVLPRPGVGKGRLAWEDVEPFIRPLLDDRFVVLCGGTEYRDAAEPWQEGRVKDGRIKPKAAGLSGRELLARWIVRGRMTQTEAASQIGVSRVKLSQYLNQERRPSLETAIRIEDATGIGMRAWLLEDAVTEGTRESENGTAGAVQEGSRGTDVNIMPKACGKLGEIS